MRTFDHTDGDDIAARFAAQLETALLAQALAETGSLPDERTKALLAEWLLGTYNASAIALPGVGGAPGDLRWEPDGSCFRLTWYMAAGLACPLARLYPQANGTWAALILAGVKDELIEAMAAAEWGVSRLTSR